MAQSRRSSTVCDGVSRIRDVGPAKGWAMLYGVTVMVIEDEKVIALDLAAILTQVGATVLGPVTQLQSGHSIFAQSKIDIATLDVGCDQATCAAIADELDDRDIPIVFITGCERENLPVAHRNRPIVAKPFSEGAVINAIREVLEAQG